MRYRHLTQDERYQIDALLCAGCCDAQIACELGRHASTIARERRRNPSGNRYRAARAQALAQRRRHAASSRSHLSPAVVGHIDTGLARGWSPEQIRGRCALRGQPMVSHTTIYRHIHRRGLRHQLRLPKRRRGYGRGRPQRFTDRRPIQQRPAEVAACVRLGDWELDTVRPAKGRGVLVTMNERVSGLICLGWSPTGKASDVALAIVTRLCRWNQHVHTLTCDRGSEFADDAFIELMLEATMYFADPHAPWQRARNENGNGLVRQYFPRSLDFNTITAEQLQHAEDALNDRPRKRLNFLTPTEVFFNYDRLALQS
ncbi:MAG: IS30 family transposase [Nitrospiraceae bacterium]